MKIEFDTDEIIKQLREDIESSIEPFIDHIIEQRVAEEISCALNKQLDHIEKTPYNIIHHRVYAMLDKYIEQEIKNRVFEQECKERRNEKC